MSRQITIDAIYAMFTKSNFVRSNTAVKYDKNLNGSFMYLFDNLIAIYYHDVKQLTITTAGWNTSTTRERLNGLPQVRVTQKNYELFLNDSPWDGNPVTIDLCNF